jgi:hypothetical protein
MAITENVISGALIPGSNSIYYSFPLERLQAASLHLFGGTLDEVAKREWAIGAEALKPNELPSINWESERSYLHLRVYLTHYHELLHLRQLSTSPIGFILWAMQSRDYAKSTQFLMRWGKRVAKHGVVPQLPLLEHHSSDPEIEHIRKIKLSYSIISGLFRGGIDDVFTRQDAVKSILPLTYSEIEPVCEKLLKAPGTYPNIGMMLPNDMSISANNITGEAIIEGFARSNEYLIAVAMGAPKELLNRYLVEKGHGKYQVAITLVENLTKTRSPSCFGLTAVLADWALQAPVLPFLLKGRSSVTLEELLPAWRFFLLTSRFHQYGFSYSDIMQNYKEVEDKLFNGLHWLTPTEVSERILNAVINVPSPSLTKLVVKKLLLAAEIRKRNAVTLAFPFVSQDVNELMTGMGMFSDGSCCAFGELSCSDSRWVELWMTLFDDATVDSLCGLPTLYGPLRIARAMLRGSSKVTPESLLKQRLQLILGQVTAERLLDSLTG